MFLILFYAQYAPRVGVDLELFCDPESAHPADASLSDEHWRSAALCPLDFCVHEQILQLLAAGGANGAVAVAIPPIANLNGFTYTVGIEKSPAGSAQTDEIDTNPCLNYSQSEAFVNFFDLDSLTNPDVVTVRKIRQFLSAQHS